jgi:hypothetical protein
MTLIIQKPTGAKLNLAKNYPADNDSRAYIAAVEAADGQSLESGVKMAIDAFVLGCKADGIWTAIKASCILAGARTLAGALVPLVGTAPTSFNFVAGDYNRKTGLVGNGSTKYLNSNRANNADPQDSKHLAAYLSSAETRSAANSWYMRDGAAVAGRSVIGVSGMTASRFLLSLNTFNSLGLIGNRDVGLVAGVRTSSVNVNYRLSGTTSSLSESSQTPTATNIGVFADSSGSGHTDARFAFYSIGESLDLALLDARVTDLINAFAAAIP